MERSRGKEEIARTRENVSTHERVSATVRDHEGASRETEKDRGYVATALYVETRQLAISVFEGRMKWERGRWKDGDIGTRRGARYSSTVKTPTIWTS